MFTLGDLPIICAENVKGGFIHVFVKNENNNCNYIISASTIWNNLCY